jgi:hypothetical protein
MRTHYEDLEQQVSYWRDRAERAEGVLRGQDWQVTLRPLSLSQTRLMRLLAGRDCTVNMFIDAMCDVQPNISDSSVKAQLCLIRRKLPIEIAPTYGHGGMYSVRDRAALKAFLQIEADEERAAT